MSRACVICVVLAAQLICARADQDVAVGIAGPAGATVTGELGRPLSVRCRAYGHPPPAVYWYRGRDLLLNSSEQYETRGKMLLIRELTIDKLGEYECQASSGGDSRASWRVVVRAYQPRGPYLVERREEQVPHAIAVHSNVRLSARRPNCSSYRDECTKLERTCPYRLKLSRSAEGCARCECEEPTGCGAQRRDCDTLRCRYGVERVVTPDRCETCSYCLGPPCYTVCSLQFPTSQPLVSSSLSNTHTPERPNCISYTNECMKLESTCAYKLKLSKSSEGCARCKWEEPPKCGAQQRQCDTLQCPFGVRKTNSSDGCEKCACLESPCNTKKCPKGERCVASPSRDPVFQEIRYAAKCETNKPAKEAGMTQGKKAGQRVSPRTTPRRGSQECESKKKTLALLQMFVMKLQGCIL